VENVALERLAYNTSGILDALPFFANHNVEWVTLLELLRLLSALIDLLIDGSNPSVDISLQNLSPNHIRGDILSLVKGASRRRLFKRGNGAGQCRWCKP